MKFGKAKSGMTRPCRTRSSSLKRGMPFMALRRRRSLANPPHMGVYGLPPKTLALCFRWSREKGLENTEIVLNGDTPGGESRVAKTSPRKQQMKRAKTRDYRAPPPRFGRRD